MKRHLNTLFVTTEGTYLAKDGQAVQVRHEKQTLLRVPLHNLDGIVCFGRVGFSSQLAGACAEANVTLSLMTPYGKVLGGRGGFHAGQCAASPAAVSGGRRRTTDRRDRPQHGSR